MIDKVFNILTSPSLISTAQNTKAAVTIETSLKAAGRPAFTLMDKNVDEKTRRYSAAKELIYQALCLGIYLALIIPVFKKGTFKIYKKIYSNHPDFQKFDNATEYLNYHKLATFSDKGSKLTEKASGLLKKAEKLASKSGMEEKIKALKAKAAELTSKGTKLREDELAALPEKLKNEFDPKLNGGKINKYVDAKGAIEFSSLVGSVVGLTILAPELSHLMLHPIMKGLGMEKPLKSNPKTSSHDAEQSQALDKKA